MKFLIYKAKTSFLTFLEDVLSEKIVRTIFGTPRVLILDVVASHPYPSSRWKSENFHISDLGITGTGNVTGRF